MTNVTLRIRDLNFTTYAKYAESERQQEKEAR